LRKENPVLLTTSMVMRRAKYVKINYESIPLIAAQLADEGVRRPEWSKEKHLVADDKGKMLENLVFINLRKKHEIELVKIEQGIDAYQRAFA